MSAGRELAQVNVALPRAPLDSPALAGFVAALEPVNALADRAAGFVWRLQTDAGDATAVRGFDDARLLVNMSVWRSLEALWAFVYDGDHLAVMRRRREWFARLATMHMALWWVPAGHRPDVAEAEERLAHLVAHGSGPHAFGFRRPFAADGSPVDAEALRRPAAGCAI